MTKPKGYNVSRYKPHSYSVTFDCGHTSEFKTGNPQRNEILFCYGCDGYRAVVSTTFVKSQ